MKQVDIGSFENSLRIPDELHIQSFRNRMADIGTFLLEAEKTANTKEVVLRPIELVDLSKKLITNAPYSWDDTPSASSGYCPDVDNPSTWMGDAEAKEWYTQCGVKHIQKMQQYQEKRMLHYLLTEKMKEVKVLLHRIRGESE